MRFGRARNRIPWNLEMRLFRRIRTVVTGVSCVVACVCGVAHAREPDVPFRALVPNSWTLFRERLTHSAADLFHQAGTLGFGTLPFPSTPRDARLLQAGKQRMRPGRRLDRHLGL